MIYVRFDTMVKIKSSSSVQNFLGTNTCLYSNGKISKVKQRKFVGPICMTD